MTQIATREIFWTNRVIDAEYGWHVLEIVDAFDRKAILSPTTLWGQQVFSVIGLPPQSKETPKLPEWEIVLSGKWENIAGIALFEARELVSIRRIGA
jgi:hypothetical protein